MKLRCVSTVSITASTVAADSQILKIQLSAFLIGNFFFFLTQYRSAHNHISDVGVELLSCHGGHAFVRNKRCTFSQSASDRLQNTGLRRSVASMLRYFCSVFGLRSASRAKYTKHTTNKNSYRIWYVQVCAHKSSLRKNENQSYVKYVCT